MMLTCETPSKVESWVASRLRAYWSTLEIGTVSEYNDTKKIGWLDGSFLRWLGGLGMLRGNRRRTPEIAACTSVEALSILRSSRNCRVMLVLPCELREVMESSAGTEAKAFSSGVATAEAMVSGSAPGRLACTLMVGKSTLGSSLTGRIA